MLLRLAILFVLAVTGAVWLVRAAPRIRLLFVFAAVHVCVFFLKFPATGQGGRYQPLTLLLLFPCIFFGLLYVLQRTVRNKRAAAGISALLLLVCGGTSLRTWRIVSIYGIAHINNTHAQAARWLISNAPPTAKVAAFDIGRISYDWHHPIIDLGGLVDPSYTPYLLNHRVPAYVQQQHADYLILPSGTFASDLGFSQLPISTMVAEFCSTHDVWDVSWLYTGNAEQCQTIYRLHR